MSEKFEEVRAALAEHLKEHVSLARLSIIKNLAEIASGSGWSCSSELDDHIDKFLQDHEDDIKALTHSEQMALVRLLTSPTAAAPTSTQQALDEIRHSS